MDVIKQEAYILLQALICEAGRTTVSDAVTTLAMHVEYVSFGTGAILVRSLSGGRGKKN
jgi:hypothetical protein